MICDIKKWRNRYENYKFIDIYSYLSKENIQDLRLLEIIIENKLYTELEFEVIEMELERYYESDKDGNIIMSDFLSKTNISLEN